MVLKISQIKNVGHRYFKGYAIPKVIKCSGVPTKAPLITYP